MMQLILSALAGAIGGASIAGLGMIYSAAVGGKRLLGAAE